MASFEIDFTNNIKEARASLRNYEKRQLPVATQRALNKTLDAAFTITKRVLSDHISITKTNIGRRLHKRKAPAGGDTAKLVIEARKVPNLASFKHTTQTKLIKGKRRLSSTGIYASVWEKRRMYKRAFIWDRGGSKTAFKRVKGAAKKKPTLSKVSNPSKYIVKRAGTYNGHRLEKGDVVLRQPLEPVFGADIAQVFVVGSKKGLAPRAQILREIEAEWPKKLAHEITRLRNR